MRLKYRIDKMKQRAREAVMRLFGIPRFWVATYGDMGLDVTHYMTKAEYDEAVRLAEDDHDCDRVDSYTCGDVI